MRDYDLADVLDGIRTGESYASVGARCGISRALVSRLAIRHGLRRRPEYAKQPLRLCACGTKTNNLGACRRCRDLSSYDEPTPADGLPEGDWVLDRQARILRWEAA